MNNKYCEVGRTYSNEQGNKGVEDRRKGCDRDLKTSLKRKSRNKAFVNGEKKVRKRRRIEKKNSNILCTGTYSP